MMKTNAPRPTTASLYVGDLDTTVTEANLYEIFKAIGPVASIRVCRDAITRQSLGYAYVNFHKVQDAERALDTLNYTQIKTKACRIMWCHRDPSVRRSGAGNVFIKNLHEDIDHSQLYATFSQFGNILSCKVVCDEHGKSKGYGFVHYESEDAANLAISKVNGSELEGKILFVAPFLPRKERQEKFTNVYAKNLPESVADDEQLKKLFESYGEIQSSKLMVDADSKTRGFGFVNFVANEAAQNAVNDLNGKTLEGASEPLYVARAQKKAERAQVLKSQRSERAQKYQGINLYIKNLDESVDEAKLREAFTPFGDITSAVVMTNDKGVSKGFGFVCYQAPEEAQRAIAEMNNKLLANKPVYVSLAEPKEVRKSRLEAQYQARAQRMGPGQPMAGVAPMYAGQPMFYPPGAAGAPGGRGFPMQAFPPAGVAGGRGGRYPPGAVGGQRPYGAVPQPGMMQHPVAQRRQRGRGAPVAAGRGAGAVKTEAPLNIASLESMSQEERHEALGNQLFPLVQNLAAPEHTAKITGMLLESLSPEDVVGLIQREDDLKNYVAEATQMIKKNEAQPAEGQAAAAPAEAAAASE